MGAVFLPPHYAFGHVPADIPQHDASGVDDVLPLAGAALIVGAAVLGDMAHDSKTEQDHG